MSGWLHAPAALPRGEKPGTHQTGGWVGLSGNRRFSNPWPSHYIDCIIPTLLLLKFRVLYLLRLFKRGGGEAVARVLVFLYSLIPTYHSQR
jgi:hypothetical protein